MAGGGMGGSGMGGGGMGGQPAGGRLPGPHASEWGLVTFWRWSATSDTTYTNCSDAPSRSFKINPDFGPNAYLFYRVEPGGAIARSLTGCSLSGVGCKDESEIWNWTIKDHTLTVPSKSGELFDSDPACAFILTQKWTLTDNGTAALWHVRIDVDPDPGKADCAALDLSIKTSSPNGHGLLDCEVGYDVFMSFKHVVPQS